MPTLGEILGNKNKSIVDFPDGFYMSSDGAMNGAIRFQVYRYRGNDPIQLFDDTVYQYIELEIGFLKFLNLAKKRSNRTKFTITLMFKRFGDDKYIQMYHGELKEEVLKCFDEFRRKEN